MERAHRVSLDGVQLDEVDERIVVQGVDCPDGKDTLSAVSRGAVSGSRVTGFRRDSVDVNVKFGILVRKQAMAERAEVLEKVNAWAAGGGILRTNYKEGRRIRVKLAQAPGEGDAWAYDTVYQVVFRACGVPFWEQDTPENVISVAGAKASVPVTVYGSTETVADVTLENVSGAGFQNVSITAGSSVIELKGIGIAAQEALVIDHTADGVLRIRIRAAGGSYRTLLGKRTTGSADDLVLQPGSRVVSFSADRACRMTVNVRGRFL